MAPRMDFTPSLGSTNTIPLPHITAESVKFNFTVSISRYWADKFAEEGRQVQVWSDIPSLTHRTSDWHETPFLAEDVLDNEEDTTGPAYSLSLISPAEAASARNRASTANSEKTTLVAQFAIPQELVRHGDRYSFTFRIAGPYGRMEWLGTMSTNGQVWMGPRVGFGSTDEYESEWSVPTRHAPLAPYAIWGRKETEPAHTEVAIGIFEGLDMKGWSFGSEGVSPINSTKDTSDTASLLVLHPSHPTITSHLSSEALPPIIISSDSHSGIRIKDSRLYATTSSVTIWEPTAIDVVPILSALVSNATLGEYEVASNLMDNHFVIIAASAASSGVLIPGGSIAKTLYIIPTVTQDHAAVIDVPGALIKSLQPDADSIGLASFASGDIFQIGSPNQQPGDIPVRVGRDGGEIAVLSMTTLTPSKISVDGPTPQTVALGVAEPKRITGVKTIDYVPEFEDPSALIDTTPTEEHQGVGINTPRIDPEAALPQRLEPASDDVDLGSPENDLPAHVDEAPTSTDPALPPIPPTALTKDSLYQYPGILPAHLLLWVAILFSVLRALVDRLENIVPPTVLPHLQRMLPPDAQPATVETMDVAEEPTVATPVSEEPEEKKEHRDAPEVLTPPWTPPPSRKGSLISSSKVASVPISQTSTVVVHGPPHGLSFVLPPNTLQFKFLLASTEIQGDLEVKVDGVTLVPTKEVFKSFVTYDAVAERKTDGVVTIALV